METFSLGLCLVFNGAIHQEEFGYFVFLHARPYQHVGFVSVSGRVKVDYLGVWC